MADDKWVGTFEYEGDVYNVPPLKRYSPCRTGDFCLDTDRDCDVCVCNTAEVWDAYLASLDNNAGDEPADVSVGPIKDSGKRAEFASGMVRDTEDGKPRFDLLRPVGVPYEEQFFTRVARHMTHGIAKYGERNWEKANSHAEYERFKRSAERHLNQWLAGETDEDHAAALVFNVLAAETIKSKVEEEV